MGATFDGCKTLPPPLFFKLNQVGIQGELKEVPPLLRSVVPGRPAVFVNEDFINPDPSAKFGNLELTSLVILSRFVRYRPFRERGVLFKNKSRTELVQPL